MSVETENKIDDMEFLLESINEDKLNIEFDLAFENAIDIVSSY